MAGRTRVCLIGANEEETEAQNSSWAFIWRWFAPRHDAERGEDASERERDEHVVVLSSRSGERMRTTPPSLIFHEGV
jgi:hypothetical protein